MRYQKVCIEALGYTLPDEVVRSDEIERGLQPLYKRLRLQEGRLELMTGISERRFWTAGTLPSDKSVESAEKAIAAAGIDRRRIGVLIHASVCRDHLEPATACRVHHCLQLSPHCMVYDVSNACLGIINGMVQIANMIELGQTRAGIVVGTESGRHLVEHTIEFLNASTSLTRRQLKTAVASLTIGSGSCAVLLVDRELSRTGNRLAAGTVRAHTENHQLCQSGRDEAVSGGMTPLMDTDSEQLMRQGIRTGAETFADFLAETGWTREQIDRSFCHQVGTTHRKLMLEAFGLDERIDFATVNWLGNTGSVALPMTMAIALEQGLVKRGERVGMLGIGSGINSLMLGAQWQTSLVGGASPRDAMVSSGQPHPSHNAATESGIPSVHSTTSSE
ncbi:MAG: 3-oxoacyl-ACP synthase III [Planctomycetota bacterium]